MHFQKPTSTTDYLPSPPPPRHHQGSIKGHPSPPRNSFPQPFLHSLAPAHCTPCLSHRSFSPPPLASPRYRAAGCHPRWGSPSASSSSGSPRGALLELHNSGEPLGQCHRESTVNRTVVVHGIYRPGPWFSPFENKSEIQLNLGILHLGPWVLLKPNPVLSLV
jgi:hypothetical protein